MQIHGLSSWSDDRCVCFFLECRNEVTRGFVIFRGRSWWRQGRFEPLVLVRPIFHFLVFVAWHIVIRFSRCWRGERIWKTEMAFSFDETFFFLLLKNVHCIVHDFPIIKNTEFLPNLTVDQQNCPKRLPKSQNELLTKLRIQWLHLRVTFLLLPKRIRTIRTSFRSHWRIWFIFVLRLFLSFRIFFKTLFTKLTNEVIKRHLVKLITKICTKLI